MKWNFWLSFVFPNLNWIIPSVTSFIFTVVTIVLICFQSKWQRNEKKVNSDLMDHQLKLQQAQICIDLAEKRLKIYNAFEEVFRNIANGNGADVSILKSFRSNTAGIGYFFGEDIQKFHEELDKKIFDYRLICTKVDRVLDGTSIDNKHSENVEKQLRMAEEFDDEKATLAEKFKPYFDFSRYQVN